MHYNRKRRHGSTDTRINEAGGGSGQCMVSGCKRNAWARHMCLMHYKRWLIHGNTDVVIQGHPPESPLGYVKEDGKYNVVKTERGWEYEHRVVMEKKIGRPLRKDEHVHHINGNGHDNREENLQLMSATDHYHLHWGWQKP